MKKTLITLSLLLPTIAFTCVVNDDGTHDCGNQPMAEANNIHVTSVEEIKTLKN